MADLADVDVLSEDEGNCGTSSVDEVEKLEPEAGCSNAASRPNPFARFAFSSPGEKSDSATRKRKAPKRFLSSTDPPSPRSPSSSKKVKVYHHLQGIDDHLERDLDIMFCGINPGEQSSRIGHHYGNPTNHFWSSLHESGLTSRRLHPTEDAILPKQFSIGLTNLVRRPTVEQSELSKAEQVSGVSALLQRITTYQPRIVCFVGLGIADIFKVTVTAASKRTTKSTKSKAATGLQSYKIVYHDQAGKETLFFAVASTSGRVVRYQKTEKVQQFKGLKSTLEANKIGSLDTHELMEINFSTTPLDSSFDTMPHDEST